MYDGRVQRRQFLLFYTSSLGPCWEKMGALTELRTFCDDRKYPSPQEGWSLYLTYLYFIANLTPPLTLPCSAFDPLT